MASESIAQDKALYDGRLLTHRRLDAGWTAYNNFLLIKNYEGCLTALSVVLTESVGALTDDSIKRYKEKIESIYQQASMLNNGSKINRNSVNDYSIKQMLLEWVISIRKETKNLYLPYEMIDTDPEQLFEKIKKQSG